MTWLRKLLWKVREMQTLPQLIDARHEGWRRLMRARQGSE